MKLTPKQAREELLNEVNNLKMVLVGAKAPYREKWIEALQMGAEALALQEPKKPRKDTFGRYCPICNHYFDPRAWKSAYCGQCGNKLDWTEESDN